MHFVFWPVLDYLPVPHIVQPSVLDNALDNVEYWPAGHSWIVQLVLTPDPEYVPIEQMEQPSVFVVASFFDEYCPAGHS